MKKAISLFFVLCFLIQTIYLEGQNNNSNTSKSKQSNFVKKVDNYFADKVKKNYEEQGGYCPQKPKLLPVTKTVWNVATCAKPVY